MPVNARATALPGVNFDNSFTGRAREARSRIDSPLGSRKAGAS